MRPAARSAAEILRTARAEAGLSQTRLAHLAGVTQSVVSAYESGQRQPSLPVLIRLVEATGADIDITLQPPSTRLRRLRGPLGRRVRERRIALLEAALGFGASNLRVFGSVARGQESAQSDVDLLVDLPAETGLFALARLEHELESILGARVDLVPAADLKPAMRGHVESDAIRL